MSRSMSCGEALVHLLEEYGVDTVFGIPGFHTLEIYRGLANSPIRHILARNEQGAGFMADGYARMSGKPGVCLLISGPGVTNACTPIGQAFADSIPALFISSTTASYSLGKGWGCTHEVTDLTAVTRPLTAFSATATSPSDLEELLAEAFSFFSSANRPRPVHIAVPYDILSEKVSTPLKARAQNILQSMDSNYAADVAKLLRQAKSPLILVGGGAKMASKEITQIAEILDAPVISTNAGKGVVSELHSLCIGGVISRSNTHEFLSKCDVILAVGTEISEADSYVERIPIKGKLIRIDIDPGKQSDLYPADINVVEDAVLASKNIITALGSDQSTRNTQDHVSRIRQSLYKNLSKSEFQHVSLLAQLKACLPSDAVIVADICQLSYTGAFAYPVELPGKWHCPNGYCALGCGLPVAIGGALGIKDVPVVVLVGDGGLMFTAQELITASELNLSLPIIVWNNHGLKQIKDDMEMSEIPAIGVDGNNPDFLLLAEACGCNGIQPKTKNEFSLAVTQALNRENPTVIEVIEGSQWLLEP